MSVTSLSSELNRLLSQPSDSPLHRRYLKLLRDVAAVVESPTTKLRLKLINRLSVDVGHELALDLQKTQEEADRKALEVEKALEEAERKALSYELTHYTGKTCTPRQRELLNGCYNEATWYNAPFSDVYCGYRAEIEHSHWSARTRVESGPTLSALMERVLDEDSQECYGGYDSQTNQFVMGFSNGSFVTFQIGALGVEDRVVRVTTPMVYTVEDDAIYDGREQDYGFYSSHTRYNRGGNSCGYDQIHRMFPNIIDVRLD